MRGSKAKPQTRRAATYGALGRTRTDTGIRRRRSSYVKAELERRSYLMRTLKKQFQMAVSLPDQLPLFGQLLAGITFSGARIVPERHWDKLSSWLVSHLDKFDKKAFMRRMSGAGWKVVDNHVRTDQHESWQWFTFHKMVEEDSSKIVWVIPKNELICLSDDSTDEDDFCNVCRLVFIGSEDELDEAVEKLISIA